MKISLIIPIYNKEKWIDRLIDSIEIQSYTNYEVVFIDDGSNDNSKKIIISRINNNPNIKLFSQSNQGPGKARLNGFSKCSGDLIYFVDGDDFLPNENVFIDIIKIFSEYKPDVLLFDRTDLTNFGTSNINFFHRSKKNIKSGKYNIEDFPNVYIPGGLGCKVFKKSILNNDMFIDFTNFEDSYTSYLYLDKCHTFYYLNKSLYIINSVNENHSLTKNSSFFSPKYIGEKLYVLLELEKKVVNLSLKKSIISIFPLEIVNTTLFIFLHKLTKSDKSMLVKYIRTMKQICLNSKVKPNMFESRFGFIKKIIYYLIMLTYSM